MPELPEVETVRTALAPRLTGRILERVEITDPRLVSPEDPRAVAAELEGERVRAVERRGKYLLVRFESGRVLVGHLRMTGSYALLENGAGDPGDPHRRATVLLDDGSTLGYRDVRRFGTWRLLEGGALNRYLDIRLGVEPLEAAFTASWLADHLTGRRAPIKAAILDQRTVAGLGNIYADEALWRARINPWHVSRDLRRDQVARLHRGIRAALRHGIARQGATLRDYRRPRGEPGRMQHEFHVYGRTGEPCDRCGSPISKTRVGGRGTWFCNICQPAIAEAVRSGIATRWAGVAPIRRGIANGKAGGPSSEDPQRQWEK